MPLKCPLTRLRYCAVDLAYCTRGRMMPKGTSSAYGDAVERYPVAK